MNINVCRTLKINAPNIRWNTYECICKTNFWGNETYFIKVKDKTGEYAKEEHKILGDEWRILEYEIGLINWLFKEWISKNDLETIKSQDFLNSCKEYQDKGTIYVNAILDCTKPVHMLIKKRWALELWGSYQNNYHFGIGKFKVSNGKSIGYSKSSPGSVGTLQVNGIWYSPVEVDAPFWSWLEEYKLLY